MWLDGYPRKYTDCWESSKIFFFSGRGMRGNLFLLGHILDLRKTSGDNRVVEVSAAMVHIELCDVVHQVLASESCDRLWHIGDIHRQIYGGGLRQIWRLGWFLRQVSGLRTYTCTSSTIRPSSIQKSYKPKASQITVVSQYSDERKYPATQ